MSNENPLKCPECGGLIVYWRGFDCWGHDPNVKNECPIDLTLDEDEWRALCALRKPLTEEEARALRNAEITAWDNFDACMSLDDQEKATEWRIKAIAASDAIQNALTGKS